MQSFYATGLLFFIWPMVILTLLMDYAWDAAAFSIAFRCAGVQNRWSAFKNGFFAVFVTSFGADALLAGLLLLLTILAQHNAAVADWLNAPFGGMGGTLAALGCIAMVPLCGLLKYVLYKRIVFRKAKGMDDRQRRVVSAVLAALTAPWTFLIPTASASAWMGQMMMGVGKLAGEAALPSLEALDTIGME